MILQDSVTNITHFGAFIDIGVHQNGLVYISSMTNQFVTAPHELIKTDDIVHVKVLSIDMKDKHVALSMRLDEKIADKKDKTASENA